jgi:hypothetical protein
MPTYFRGRFGPFRFSQRLGRTFRRFAVPVFGVALALGGASSASAQTNPTFTFFKTALPVVGTQLSDSTLAPFISLKDGWTISSPYGISGAQVFYCPASACDCSVQPSQGTCPAIWSGDGADTVTGKYQWSQQVGGDNVNLLGFAVDHRLDTWSNSTNISPSLSDSGSAAYSPGWRASFCRCYTSGQILYSSTPGATATFQVSSPDDSLVSFVSDTGPTRGKAALTINGHTTDVNLKAGTTNGNRMIVWNSGYLKFPGNTYTLTVKVISGRVDVEGFIGTVTVK